MNNIYMKKYVSYAYKLNSWIILIWKMYVNYGWVIYIIIHIYLYYVWMYKTTCWYDKCLSDYNFIIIF